MEEALAQRQGDSFQVDMGQKSGPVAQTLKRSNAGEANVQVRFEEKTGCSNYNPIISFEQWMDKTQYWNVQV